MADNYPQDIIDRVKEAVDIVDVISSRIQIKRSGANYSGLCPFHQEKSPSFSVSPTKQIFHCFGCGEGGNSISFVMKYDNLNFPEALKLLAEHGGVALPSRGSAVVEDYSRLYEANKTAAIFYRDALRSVAGDSAVSAYIEKRGLSKQTLERFGIGYAKDSWDSLLTHMKTNGYSDKEIERAGLAKPSSKGNLIDQLRDRLIFPILDERKRVVAFGGRALSSDTKAPKYINSPETPIYRKGRLFFGLSSAGKYIKELDQALVVEGYMDLVTLSQAGVMNVVASSGTAFTEYHVRILKRYTSNFVMVFDGDKAGRSAAERATRIAMDGGVRPKIAILPAGQDPDDLIREGGEPAFRRVLAMAKPFISYLIDSVCESAENSPEGKADAVKELVPEMSKMTDAIERAAAVQLLAERLGIDESLLEARLPRLKGMRISRVIQPPNGDGGKSLLVEKWVIQVLLDRPLEGLNMLNGIEPSDFASGNYRHLFVHIKEQVDGGITDVTKIIDSMEEEGGARLLRELLLGESGYEKDEWSKNLEDFVTHTRKKERLQQIQAAKEAAKAAGNAD